MADSVNQAELERRRRRRELEEAANKSGEERKARTADPHKIQQSKDPGSVRMQDPARRPPPGSRTPRVSTESSGVTAGSISPSISDTSAANTRPSRPPGSTSQPGDRPKRQEKDAITAAWEVGKQSGVFGGRRPQGPPAPPGGEMAANRRPGDSASPTFKSEAPPRRPAGGGITATPGKGAVAKSPPPGAKPGTKASAGTGGPRRGGYRAGQGKDGFSKGSVKVNQPQGGQATYKNKTKDQAKRLEKMLSRQGPARDR